MWIRILFIKRGCLHGKTPEMKNDFFKSLSGFISTDGRFFIEQYKDLLPNEKIEFNKWLENNISDSIKDEAKELLQEFKNV